MQCMVGGHFTRFAVSGGGVLRRNRKSVSYQELHVNDDGLRS